jgi:hypothetical protein
LPPVPPRTSATVQGGRPPSTWGTPTKAKVPGDTTGTWPRIVIYVRIYCVSRPDTL